MVEHIFIFWGYRARARARARTSARARTGARARTRARAHAACAKPIPPHPRRPPTRTCQPHPVTYTVRPFGPWAPVQCWGRGEGLAADFDDVHTHPVEIQNYLVAKGYFFDTQTQNHRGAIFLSENFPIRLFKILKAKRGTIGKFGGVSFVKMRFFGSENDRKIFGNFPSRRKSSENNCVFICVRSEKHRKIPRGLGPVASPRSC